MRSEFRLKHMSLKAISFYNLPVVDHPRDNLSARDQDKLYVDHSLQLKIR